MPYNGDRSEMSTIYILEETQMLNWKKVLETTLSVGVAVAASIIGDKFVAKAAKTITGENDVATDEPIEAEVVEKETEDEETEEKVEETED